MVLIELILNAYYGVVAGALMAWTHIPLWGGWSTGVALTATVLYAVVMLVASMTGDIACSQTLAKVISMFHVARFVAVAVPFIYVVCIR